MNTAAGEGMMDTIAAIHACPWKGVVAITGCAPGLVTDLLAPGGGSATLLEAVVPYATKSLLQFIGGAPKRYCSEDVAKEMASAAFSRATELLDVAEGEDNPVFGLGITATLRKNGPEREGRTHQVFISFQTATMVYNHHIVFNNTLSRLDEEYLVTQVSLAVLSRHLLDKRYKIAPTFPDGSPRDILDNREDSWFVMESTVKQQFPTSLQRLLEDRAFEVIWDYSDKECVASSACNNRIVIPGSFNPLHEGHLKMVELAKKRFGEEPILELSIGNVDKGRLSGHEVLKRGESITSRCQGLASLYFTNAPTFVEKSYLFSESTFVIGIDTWYRLLDLKYYRHSQAVLDESMAKIKENGCNFLVMGRFVNGQYHTLPAHRKKTSYPNVTGLSEEEFRIDLSSTQLRAESGSVG